MTGTYLKDKHPRRGEISMRLNEFSDLDEEVKWWNPTTWLDEPKFNPDITPMKKGYKKMKKKMSTDPEYAKKIQSGNKVISKKNLDDQII